MRRVFSPNPLRESYESECIPPFIHRPDAEPATGLQHLLYGIAALLLLATPMLWAANGTLGTGMAVLWKLAGIYGGFIFLCVLISYAGSYLVRRDWTDRHHHLHTGDDKCPVCEATYFDWYDSPWHSEGGRCVTQVVGYDREAVWEALNS